MPQVNYVIVEWTEPSYGYCIMSKPDADMFNAIETPIKNFYNKRNQILKTYSEQFPFKGDGKLFTYNYDDYIKTLPKSKLDTASKVKSVYEGVVNSNVTGGFDFYSFVRSTNSGSEEIKTNPKLLYENTVCLSKSYVYPNNTNIESVKLNNGNTLKIASISTMPIISDSADQVGEEVAFANTKLDASSKSIVDTVTNQFKSKIGSIYTALQLSYNTINSSINNYKSNVANLISQSTDITNSINTKAGQLSNLADTYYWDSYFAYDEYATNVQNDIQGNAARATGEAVGEGLDEFQGTIYLN